MAIDFRAKIETIKTLLLYIFAFSIPFWQKLSTIIIFVFLAITLIGYQKQNGIQRNNKALLLLPALYVLYILSMLIFPSFDVKIMEMKASLLIFPIVFYLNNYSVTQLQKAFKYFILGCLAAVVLCFLNALYHSFSIVDGAIRFNTIVNTESSGSFLQSAIKGGNYFFGDYFSMFHQTVYFALYINIALIGSLSLKLFSSKWKAIIALVLVIALFLISNRSNILLTCIIFGVFMLFSIEKKSLKIAFVLGTIVIAALVLIQNPRTGKMIKAITSNGVTVDREVSEGYGLRVLVWDAAFELMSASPNVIFTGVGVTNTYSELKKVYKKKRYIAPFRNALNAHNQYLQLLIEVGILGLLLVLFMLRFFYTKHKEYFLLGIFFLIVFSFNFLFESVFNRYSGIMSFSFFYCLFISLKNKKS